MNNPSPFRQLPEGASYLPSFLHKFVELVAKAAHNFVHANDDQLFNLAKFWSGMRMSLYNTGRNEKKRGSPGPAAGPEVQAAEVPPSKNKKPESNDGTEDEHQEADEFFNFRRPGKDDKGVAGDRNEQDRNESEPDTEVPNRTPPKPPASDTKEGKRKAEGTLTDATPGKMQRQNTMKSKMKDSVYDQLASAAALGQTVDEIVELLRARHAIWKDSRSRNYKRHCDKIATLIVELCNADPKDSWKTIIEGHKPSLSKMPADFY